MHLLITVAVVLQVISAVAIIVLVLLQHGKGADMGAAFGGGASGSLFGATGSANFLSRLSTVTTEQKAPAQPTPPVPATNTSDFTDKPAQNQIPR